MPSFNDLRDRIRDDLLRSTNDNTRIENSINDAITHYQSHRFYFNENQVVTFNTVVGQDFYSFGDGGDITTDLYRIDLAEVTDGGQDYSLTSKPYTDLLKWQDSSSTNNRPYCYAYVNQGLLLYNKPDAAYAVTLSGHIKLAAPSGDNENDWTNEAFELLRCQAKMYFAAHFLEDANLALSMAPMAASALKALNDATTARVTSGAIAPTEF